ncbi:MAG: hypothetical protein JWR19_3784 [Pedosphaera sp.]|nr:hypothetical protein [Pedosphaera sp.]
MKVLIQNAEDQKYLNGQNEWTAAATEARDFRMTSSAYRVAQAKPIQGFHVVFYFADLNYSINVMEGKGAGVLTAPM